MPAVLIGRLGRDQKFRGEGIGPMLWQDAIVRIAASHIGAYTICADAIDESAAAFYRRHLFQAFIERPQSFYLPLQAALANLKD